MHKKSAAIAGVTLLCAATLSADFSYHETTRVTGGVLAGALKVAGVFSKQAREPIESTVAIRGNRMARRSSTHGDIIDLDGETITNIDFQKKTYTVVTFEQMRQMLENAMNRVKESKDKSNTGDAKSDTSMAYKVTAKPTGNTRQIAGYDAKEMVIQIEMEATDKKSGQSGSMVVTTHAWIASGIPGASEMRDFAMKMAKKISWTPGGNAALLSNADAAKGMAEAYKEIAKLDGTAVLQIVSMGPPGSAPPDGAVPAAQEKQEKPSLSGALGGAFGGKFGLGKKKSSDEPKAEDNRGAQSAGSGSLIDTTTEFSNFLQSADPSLFEVPAGFKKVESELNHK